MRWHAVQYLLGQLPLRPLPQALFHLSFRRHRLASCSGHGCRSVSPVSCIALSCHDPGVRPVPCTALLALHLALLIVAHDRTQLHLGPQALCQLGLQLRRFFHALVEEDGAGAALLPVLFSRFPLMRRAAAGVRCFNSRPPGPGPGARAVSPHYLGPAANVGR
jgi:hypothetical protein